MSIVYLIVAFVIGVLVGIISVSLYALFRVASLDSFSEVCDYVEEYQVFDKKKN